MGDSPSLGIKTGWMRASAAGTAAMSPLETRRSAADCYVGAGRAASPGTPPGQMAYGFAEASAPPLPGGAVRVGDLAPEVAPQQLYAASEFVEIGTRELVACDQRLRAALQVRIDVKNLAAELLAQRDAALTALLPDNDLPAIARLGPGLGFRPEQVLARAAQVTEDARAAAARLAVRSRETDKHALDAASEAAARAAAADAATEAVAAAEGELRDAKDSVAACEQALTEIGRAEPALQRRANTCHAELRRYLEDDIAALRGRGWKEPHYRGDARADKHLAQQIKGLAGKKDWKAYIAAYDALVAERQAVRDLERSQAEARAGHEACRTVAAEKARQVSAQLPDLQRAAAAATADLAPFAKEVTRQRLREQACAGERETLADCARQTAELVAEARSLLAQYLAPPRLSWLRGARDGEHLRQATDAVRFSRLAWSVDVLGGLAQQAADVSQQLAAERARLQQVVTEWDEDEAHVADLMSYDALQNHLRRDAWAEAQRTLLALKCDLHGLGAARGERDAELACRAKQDWTWDAEILGRARAEAGGPHAARLTHVAAGLALLAR